MTSGTNAAVRIGLVGAGPWARAVHAPGLAAHPGVELVGVWARRPAAAVEVAAGVGAVAVADFDELLGRVDAVAFAVPPSVQGALAVRAVRAGRHVLLEKPVADSVAAAEDVVAAVEAAGVASMVVFIRRFAPETEQWLADVRAEGGWAGGTAQWLSGALLGGDYSSSPWRQAGGALGDVGPHVLDLLDAALGPVTRVLSAHRGEPDLWQLVLGHEGGASSTVTLSMRLPMRPTVTSVSVFGQAGQRELVGRTTQAPECYARLLDDFLALVHTGHTHHPLDVWHGLHIQRTLEAILLAVEER
ncbi:Gfo/Idh/MocA family protein [Actinokineospora pegani]|uniref:Gfo/Idh/MocA family protein n=1 Tax=Actinokineospora pegani TaxID=2654637 RepID=UPI001F485F9A|nr:Gfo/Idh/MocA family oxidoreductase [Actinokineospora pegani]